LIVPSDDYVPKLNPITVYFDGSNTQQANFIA
jgi:hypothetical protein